MIFLFLSKKNFHNLTRSRKSIEDHDRTSRSLDGDPGAVRRPYRGIQIKDDTHASLSVRKPDGEAIQLVSSSALQSGVGEDSVGKVSEYADFILQRVEESRTEKHQVLETFGHSLVYFFGERPQVTSFSGVLVNTEDFNWRAQFWKNYNEHFRGTRLVQANARAYISYDTIVVEGYPIAASAQEAADNPHVVFFSLSMLVTNYTDFSDIGLARFPGAEIQSNFETLNKDLEETRSKFTSTGSNVRTNNLLAPRPVGVLAELRKGVTAVNNAVNTIKGFASAAGALMGGRVMRVPVGVASFLYSTSEPQLASGSQVAAFPDVFDARTGKFSTIYGSLVLKMPGPALYAPGRPRGYIYENIDEYIGRANSRDTFFDLLTEAAKADYTTSQNKRLLDSKSRELAANATLATLMGSGGLASLAAGVAAVRDGYGMAANVTKIGSELLAGNWQQVVQTSLGIGGGTTSAASVASEGRRDELAKIGIVVKSPPSLMDRYIGFTAGDSLKSMYNEKVVGTKLGGTLKPGTYEDVYGSNDYTGLAELVGEQRELLAALESGNTTGVKAAEIAALQDTLDEMYGDKDYRSTVPTDEEMRELLQNEQIVEKVYGTGEVSQYVIKEPWEARELEDPAIVDAVYNTGASSKHVRTPAQIQEALRAAGILQPSAEEARNIIAVEDDSTTIEPAI